MRGARGLWVAGTPPLPCGISPQRGEKIGACGFSPFGENDEAYSGSPLGRKWACGGPPGEGEGVLGGRLVW